MICKSVTWKGRFGEEKSGHCGMLVRCGAMCGLELAFDSLERWVEGNQRRGKAVVEEDEDEGGLGEMGFLLRCSYTAW